MARVEEFVTSDLTPESVWRLAGDLRRFDRWMTIFGGWRGAIPATIKPGTRVSALIKVKGFRNVIHWRVTRYDEPSSIEMVGRGRGGVRIELAMSTSARPRGGSMLHLTAGLHGGLLSGPVGRLVARILKSELRTSLANLARLADEGAAATP